MLRCVLIVHAMAQEYLQMGHGHYRVSHALSRHDIGLCTWYGLL